MEGGREQNYWPGFVDALSNVVLTLVFVLVVFVFALVIASNKVESRAVKMIQEASEKTEKGDKNEIIRELKNELKLAEAKIEELKEQEITSSIDKSEKIATSDQNGLKAIGSVMISQASNKIIIIFPKAVSDLDEASFHKLDKVLDEIADKIAGKAVVFHAYIGLESYSAARRLAYYRILGLRNHLLQRNEMKGASIKNKILQPKDRQDGRVEIIFD